MATQSSIYTMNKNISNHRKAQETNIKLPENKLMRNTLNNLQHHPKHHLVTISRYFPRYFPRCFPRCFPLRSSTLLARGERIRGRG